MGCLRERRNRCEFIDEKCQIVPHRTASQKLNLMFQLGFSNKQDQTSSFLTRYIAANFSAPSTLASTMPANSKRGLEKIAFARMWPMRPLPTSMMRAGWRRDLVGEMNVMVTILVGREVRNNQLLFLRAEMPIYLDLSWNIEEYRMLRYHTINHTIHHNS